MDKREQFFSAVKSAVTMTLATAGEGSVTMRTVSPAFYKDAVLMFTAASSRKYGQLKENPHCCLALGEFFAEAEAEFRGGTMEPENEELRRAYSEKFAGAFDEGVAFGGRGCEFILLRPVRLTGWMFENDTPVEGGIPSVPFSEDLT